MANQQEQEVTPPTHTHCTPRSFEIPPEMHPGWKRTLLKQGPVSPPLDAVGGSGAQTNTRESEEAGKPAFVITGVAAWRASLPSFAAWEPLTILPEAVGPLPAQPSFLAWGCLCPTISPTRCQAHGGPSDRLIRSPVSSRCTHHAGPSSTGLTGRFRTQEGLLETV